MSQCTSSILTICDDSPPQWLSSNTRRNPFNMRRSSKSHSNTYTTSKPLSLTSTVTRMNRPQMLLGTFQRFYCSHLSNGPISTSWKSHSTSPLPPVNGSTTIMSPVQWTRWSSLSIIQVSDTPYPILHWPTSNMKPAIIAGSRHWWCKKEPQDPPLRFYTHLFAKSITFPVGQGYRYNGC